MDKYYRDEETQRSLWNGVIKEKLPKKEVNLI